LTLPLHEAGYVAAEQPEKFAGYGDRATRTNAVSATLWFGVAISAALIVAFL
jgi:hypothetical protein